MREPRWALFLSGRGTTAQAVMDLVGEVRISWVFSNQPKALGLRRAQRMGIPTEVLPKSLSWEDLHKKLVDRRITHIFLLGFLKLIPAEFVARWEGKIFNVHPSVLPLHPGLHSIEKSYFQMDSPMGVTVHEVTAEMDAGPKLFQRVLERKPESLEKAKEMISFTEQDLVRRSVLKLRSVK